MPLTTNTLKRAFAIIAGLSALILGFLFWLIYFREESATDPAQYAFLPTLNAFLNATSATAVAIGIYQIKRGNKKAHAVCMMAATVASAFFLIGYIVYHELVGDTKFLGQGLIRPVYFFILITHILLSMAVVPMILTTLFLAAAQDWGRHKKVARWTYPVWLYVSITGIVIFLMLKYLNPTSV